MTGISSSGSSLGLESRDARRWQALVEGIPQLVWRSANDGQWTWASPQWTQFTGQTLEESLGLGWLDAVHRDDRRQARMAWRRARLRNMFEVEYRIRHAESGAWRWCQTRATPVPGDRPGEILEWLGTSTDIDDLRTAQLAQQRLLDELQHRVRNSMAVIRSIVRRTALRSDSVEDMAAHLFGRVDAFARIQAMVARDATEGVELFELISDELLTHGAQDGDRIKLGGPAVSLRPRAAELVGLAVHELASNAVKFGALGISPGHIDIRWKVREANWLNLCWREKCDTPPAPSREGFGSEFIDRTLPYELGAKTRRRFHARGLDVDIDVPLTVETAVSLFL